MNPIVDPGGPTQYPPPKVGSLWISFLDLDLTWNWIHFGVNPTQYLTPRAHLNLILDPEGSNWHKTLGYWLLFKYRYKPSAMILLMSIVFRLQTKWYKLQTNKKLALNSQLQTYQILTNDDQMLILCLPYFITTVSCTKPICLQTGMPSRRQGGQF